MKHVPVLVDEIVSIVSRPETNIVVDATIGGGGHAEAILTACKGVRLIGIDMDTEAVERSRLRLERFGGRAVIEKARFSGLAGVLDGAGVDRVDAVIMDLGVSSFHLDDPARGFSFAVSGPLDMRLDRSQTLTARDLVNETRERELAAMFKNHGEERHARRIARAIVRAREKAPIETTGRLAEIIERAVPAKARGGRIHPATRVFQAIRIAVNAELESLGPAIEHAVDRLNPGGRIAVIAFHSLEDRIVKRTLVDMTQRCVCPKDAPICTCGRPGKVRLLMKKPVAPGADEVAANPRARSAKLRAAERLAA